MMFALDIVLLVLKVTVPVKDMNLAEKLQLMEGLLADLSKEGSDYYPRECEA